MSLTKQRALRAFRDLMGRKADRQITWRGVLGNAHGVVRLTDRKDRCYVQLRASGETVAAALNLRVADVPGTPVLLRKTETGRDWEVYDVDYEMLTNTDGGAGWGGLPYGVSPHARTHEWPDGAPGTDPVNVYPRSLSMLRTYRKNASSLSVKVSPLRYPCGGELKQYSGGELSLTTYQPASGMARYVLVYLDPMVNQTYAHPGPATVDAMTVTPAAPLVPPDVYPSAIVKLTGSKTYVSEGDIVDYRLILGTVQSSAGVGTYPFAPSPEITLDSAPASGSSTLTIRSDATIQAFDTTVPTTQEMGDSPAVGTVPYAARRDHKHGMPAFANPTSYAGLTFIDGSALTPMRSDAAPAIDQSIAPTWTGKHTWRPDTDDTNVLTVQPSTGTYAVFQVDTANNQVTTAGDFIASDEISGNSVTGSSWGSLANHRWGLQYVEVNNSTYATLTHPTGVGLSTNYIYRVRLVTCQTSTDNGACYLVHYDANTSAWVIRPVSYVALSSLHPQLFLDGGVVKIKTEHATLYPVRVLTEAFYVAETDARLHVMGADHMWQRIADNLQYTDGNVIASNFELPAGGGWFRDTGTTTGMALEGDGSIRFRVGDDAGAKAIRLQNSSGSTKAALTSLGKLSLGGGLTAGGDISQSSGYDIFPDGGKRGLVRRFIKRFAFNVTNGMRSTYTMSGYGWYTSAPWTTPSTLPYVLSSDEGTYWVPDSSASQHFYRDVVTDANDIYIAGRFSIARGETSAAIGLMMLTNASTYVAYYIRNTSGAIGTLSLERDVSGTITSLGEIGRSCDSVEFALRRVITTVNRVYMYLVDEHGRAATPNYVTFDSAVVAIGIVLPPGFSYGGICDWYYSSEGG